MPFSLLALDIAARSSIVICKPATFLFLIFNFFFLIFIHYAYAAQKL